MASNVHFVHHIHPPRSALLTGWGWLAVLSVLAIAIGVVVAFAT
jgi:uncharacterized membrane protein HdeD (DUF308 family)